MNVSCYLFIGSSVQIVQGFRLLVTMLFIEALQTKQELRQEPNATKADHGSNSCITGPPLKVWRSLSGPPVGLLKNDCFQKGFSMRAVIMPPGT